MYSVQAVTKRCLHRRYIGQSRSLSRAALLPALCRGVQPLCVVAAPITGLWMENIRIWLSGGIHFYTRRVRQLYYGSVYSSSLTAFNTDFTDFRYKPLLLQKEWNRALMDTPRWWWFVTYDIWSYLEILITLIIINVKDCLRNCVCP